MVNKRIRDFQNFLNESIRRLNSSEIFDWLEQRKDFTFIALDTETTGLRGPKEDQLTQIGAVAFKYDPVTITFREIDHFNEKIALTPEIMSQLDQPGSRIRDVFKFTRYEINQDLYRDEQEVLIALKEFVDRFGKVILLIQNAPFDMPMINVRQKFGGVRHEIFDTKDFFAYFLLPTLQKLAETDPEAGKILATIGKTPKSDLPTSSLPKVAPALGVSSDEAHDALFDCRYMVRTLEKALKIVKDNPVSGLDPYVRPRILMDRYYKQKNKMKRGNLR